MNLTGEELLKKTCEDLKRDCKTRIRDLTVHLQGIENRLDRGFILNDLGEIQGLASMLDCRVASWATVRRLIDRET